MRLEFSIYRYNPDVDDAPRMQDYTLEADEGRDMMLLDALIQLKEKDPSLSFRRSCREGVCGSDGLNMNGKNGLACITPISALNQPGKKIVIRPLPVSPRPSPAAAQLPSIFLFSSTYSASPQQSPNSLPFSGCISTACETTQFRRINTTKFCFFCQGFRQRLFAANLGHSSILLLLCML